MRIQSIANVNDPTNLRLTLNQILRQVSDNTGSVSLSSGTSTMINNSKVVPQSCVILTPRNSQALDARAFVSTISTGQFSITHNAGTGAIYDYIIIGSI